MGTGRILERRAAGGRWHWANDAAEARAERGAAASEAERARQKEAAAAAARTDALQRRDKAAASAATAAVDAAAARQERDAALAEAAAWKAEATMGTRARVKRWAGTTWGKTRSWGSKLGSRLKDVGSD